MHNLKLMAYWIVWYVKSLPQSLVFLELNDVLCASTEMDNSGDDFDGAAPSPSLWVVSPRCVRIERWAMVRCHPCPYHGLTACSKVTADHGPAVSGAHNTIVSATQCWARAPVDTFCWNFEFHARTARAGKDTENPETFQMTRSLHFEKRLLEGPCLCIVQRWAPAFVALLYGTYGFVFCILLTQILAAGIARSPHDWTTLWWRLGRRSKNATWIKRHVRWEIASDGMS